MTRSVCCCFRAPSLYFSTLVLQMIIVRVARNPFPMIFCSLVWPTYSISFFSIDFPTLFTLHGNKFGSSKSEYLPSSQSEWFSFALSCHNQVSDSPSVSLFSLTLALSLAPWGYIKLGSDLLSCLLFSKVWSDVAPALFHWSRWRLVGMRIKRENCY